jgi:hypothetical protein
VVVVWQPPLADHLPDGRPGGLGAGGLAGCPKKARRQDDAVIALVAATQRLNFPPVAAQPPDGHHLSCPDGLGVRISGVDVFRDRVPAKFGNLTSRAAPMGPPRDHTRSSRRSNVPTDLVVRAGSTRRPSASGIEHRVQTPRLYPFCVLGSVRSIRSLAHSIRKALLQVTGGQGRDRTAGLPLFRSRDHRLGAATRVVCRAQRPSAASGRPRCTEVNETRNETTPAALASHSPCLTVGRTRTRSG